MTTMVNAAASTSSAAVCAKDPAMERRCDSADCNVNKLVSMVPKRKTAQFVTEPSIIEKPMLVNGFTTIFQVDGLAAKISDLRQRGNGDPRTIYRIIPNTHAHIVNYVVVDSEGESLRKINNGDPTTMKKLLDSQRISAEQMLYKLMNGQGAYMQVSSTPIANGGAKTNIQKTPVTTVTNKTPLYVPQSNVTTATSTTPINSTLGALSRVSSCTSAKLPMRSVTIKKISTPKTLPTMPITQTSPQTSTASPLSVPNAIRFNPSIQVRAISSKGSTTITPTVTTTASPALPTRKRLSTPLIKTVPLSQLQHQPAPVLVQPGVTTAASTSTAAKTNENPIFEKMQKELEDLRRTVAILAETQKKKLSEESTDGPPPNKKSLLT